MLAKTIVTAEKFMRLIQQSDRVISCDIDLRFDIDATRGASRVADRSRCHLISHDRTADQSHEYLGCNDFFGQGSTSLCCKGVRVCVFV